MLARFRHWTEALAGAGVAIDLSLSVVFRTDHPQLERLERFARYFHDEERRAVEERLQVVQKLLDKLKNAT